jgi:hypothetical protein
LIRDRGTDRHDRLPVMYSIYEIRARVHLKYVVDKCAHFQPTEPQCFLLQLRLGGAGMTQRDFKISAYQVQPFQRNPSRRILRLITCDHAVWKSLKISRVETETRPLS